ncbi:ABC transporter ATP-binding protein [Flavisolibacter tropicus]|uniref:ABC transporter ATPase n=1 Tax=Flavisolibacter tropicus TaxID=1492898 RepID=A0A172TSJ1_9BACT|nr:ATP-binding cassette domain-containing protein [Flavisolibacter tropicus]ANE50000.1 ABC transporter ATPase [Flavisolibacter tropicus]
MSESPLLKATSLTYRYEKDVATLTDINLTIEKGCIYGFLGPNGAGKTTTLSLLLGLLEVQEGHIEIFGKPLTSDRVSILKKIGSLIESPSLYGHLTAKENLEVYREVYGASKARIAEVLNIVGLEDTGKKTVKKFSLGMKQRLAIALALLPNPELLILDEPANGLDPAGIIELRKLIKTLNKTHGMTVIISSHLLGEVEKIVSHVGIIFKGKIIFQGPLSALHSFQQKASRVFIKTSDNETTFRLLQEYQPEKEGEAVSVPFENINQVAEINRKLTSHNLDVYLLYPKKSDLEQLFIDLTTAP